MSSSFSSLQKEIISCRKCPRLVRYLSSIRKKFPSYWCKPVPYFGDTAPHILLLGLAPGRFGSNRTGRMFTGDASGKFLFRALQELRLSNRAAAEHLHDGLHLKNVGITAVVRCAPPQNKPTPAEIKCCAPYFKAEVNLLKTVAVVVCLGKIAHDGFLKMKREEEGIKKADYPFKHGATYRFTSRPRYLVDAYHPSRQNTQTGRLTMAMFKSGLRTAIRLTGLRGH